MSGLKTCGSGSFRLSHEMRRRLLVIPCDRTFAEADKDPDFFYRILATELPGVLNRALEGYGA
jgi:phage/plasmid-associated DNA primase